MFRAKPCWVIVSPEQGTKQHLVHILLLGVDVRVWILMQAPEVSCHWAQRIRRLEALRWLYHYRSHHRVYRGPSSWVALQAFFLGLRMLLWGKGTGSRRQVGTNPCKWGSLSKSRLKLIPLYFFQLPQHRPKSSTGLSRYPMLSCSHPGCLSRGVPTIPSNTRTSAHTRTYAVCVPDRLDWLFLKACLGFFCPLAWVFLCWGATFPPRHLFVEIFLPTLLLPWILHKTFLTHHD